MRADMKDLIIDTSRRKYGSKRKSSVQGMSLDQMEDLPDKAGIRRNHTDWGPELTDRLGPLWAFLQKNVGRPWDKVFSEICEHADVRCVRGKHLREHVEQYVEGSGGQDHRYYRHLGPFWVDDGGILRFEGYRRWQRSEPRHDPDKYKIGDRHFDRIKGCWFEVWYEKEEKARNRWNRLLSRQEVEYYYIDVKTRQRQLSKKELRDLGLTNETR